MPDTVPTLPDALEGFIEGFEAWTDGIPSPQIFRRWAAIWAVGSAVRRQVWCELIPGVPIFPNLFIFLVGPPGVGKTQALGPMMETVRKSDTVQLAPNDVSKQSLLDALGDCKEVLMQPGSLMDYHYMAIGVRELANFMSQYDTQLAGAMTDLFDNPAVNDERKRTSKNAKTIVKPSISLIAGTATKNLGATIGAELWGSGFMSRIILVYSADQPDIEWFDENAKPRIDVSPELVNELGAIGDLKGKMVWDLGAKKAMNEWRVAKFEPFPRHSKLVEYNARRYLHVAKLAMCSALSNQSMTITYADFMRARKWLETAEQAMPEIFKEMAVHADGELLRELHMSMWANYAATRAPLHYTFLSHFLHTRTAARDIARLIEVGETSGLFSRVAGTQGTEAQYVPRAAFDSL